MSKTINYWDGTQWKPSNIHKEYNPLKAVLVCGGPSLAKINPEDLTGTGKFVLGLNNTYPYVSPDAWMGMDDPRCYDRRVLQEPFPKYLRAMFHDNTLQGCEVKNLSNVHFVSCKKGKQEQIFEKASSQSDRFLWQKNVMSTGMSLLIAMGFKEIYIVGCDLNNKEKDYFNSTVLTESDNKRNALLYSQLTDWLKWLSTSAKINGINLFSSSPDSVINDFMPYCSIKDLNDKVQKTLFKEAPLYYCKEIDKLQEETKLEDIL